MSTPDEQQIQNLLRHSPRPRPPEDLKARLITLAQSNRKNRTPQGTPTRNLRPSFSQRWWRILAPASFLLVCLFVLGVQQKEIRSLKQNIQTLTERIETGAAGTETDSRGQTTLPAAGAAEAEEIARLKEIVSRLSADISRTEQLRVENQNLRTQLSTTSPSRLSPEELAVVEESQAAALRIACVNNMKQMGLAARLWAQDDKDQLYPPDILSMTNELGTPKILYCPADPGRSRAENWSSYSDANCSYEYLAPSATDREPTRVLFRCPIHGNIGLCDGSVQSVGKTHPEWLVTRDGKLYLDHY